jgi:hypothetical protein
LLPTEPPPVTSNAAAEMFAHYRNVQWLARSHAVTMDPLRGVFADAASVASRLERARGVDRLWRIPLPAKSKRADAAIRRREAARDCRNLAQLTLRRRAGVRSTGVDSAELSRLPRLTDTAEEPGPWPSPLC